MLSYRESLHAGGSQQAGECESSHSSSDHQDIGVDDWRRPSRFVDRRAVSISIKTRSVCFFHRQIHYLVHLGRLLILMLRAIHK